jgi:SGNH hydrolase-like domain, acetyltransferase AlgX
MNRKILLGTILVFLFSFLIQQSLEIVPVRQLNGYIVPVPKPLFSMDSLLEGRYQNQISAWSNESFGFRNALVRLHNQIGFWLYNKSYTNAVIVGKENYLLDKKYIDAYTGADYLGDAVLKNKVGLVKKLQDSLQKYGIQFLFVLAPGKASYFKEYIPDMYLENKQKGNYETLTELFKSQNIQHIDFKAWFEQMKPNSPYPLFPKCGIHWSTYGATLAADSIIKKISVLTKTEIPKMSFESLHYTDSLNEVDQDVGKGMNLLFDIDNNKMAYPIVTYGKAERKIKLLTIADSYNWTMPIYAMSDHVFKQMHFLYYNKQLFVNSKGDAYEEKKIHRARLIMGTNVIMVLSTDANLAEFGWGFFEHTYNKLFNLKSETGMPISVTAAVIMNDIKFDKKRLEEKTKLAKQLNISVDSAAYLEALYLIKQEKKKQ